VYGKLGLIAGSAVLRSILEKQERRKDRLSGANTSQQMRAPVDERGGRQKNRQFLDKRAGALLSFFRKGRQARIASHRAPAATLAILAKRKQG